MEIIYNKKGRSTWERLLSFFLCCRFAVSYVYNAFQSVAECNGLFVRFVFSDSSHFDKLRFRGRRSIGEKVSRFNVAGWKSSTKVYQKLKGSD